MIQAAMRTFPTLVSLVLLFPITAMAQGSGSSRLSPPRQARPQTPAEFQQSFWKHITVTAPYRDWSRLAADEHDPRPAQKPHGPWVKTYLNAVAAKNPGRLGYGSVIVNEEYDEDKETLEAVSVMYCSKGADPAHYDWYWIKYTPDGKVMRAPAEQGSKALAGKAQSCIQCHQKAKADLVFSNDDLQAAGRSESSPQE
ncbi:MAG TPA: cytochrome P460 family protein [Pirellulales bacterium]|nr:cytochrome P460 family protein [Pirellulales bacterium]